MEFLDPDQNLARTPPARTVTQAWTGMTFSALTSELVILVCSTRWQHPTSRRMQPICKTCLSPFFCSLSSAVLFKKHAPSVPMTLSSSGCFDHLSFAGPSLSLSSCSFVSMSAHLSCWFFTRSSQINWHKLWTWRSESSCKASAARFEIRPSETAAALCFIELIGASCENELSGSKIVM